MIDTTNWRYYFKIDPETGERCCNNMLYTPLINDNEDIFCMHWDKNSPYQQLDTPHELTDELISFFFNRELYYLMLFKDYIWAPKILAVDYTEKKIFLEWNKETCNDIIYTSDRNFDLEYPDWEEQLFNILKDIVDAGYYKSALYPHCFFFDKHGNLKTIDFYGCIDHANPYIKFSQLDGMMGKESHQRFIEATEGDSLNLSIFFKKALSKHVKWPGDPFPRFFKKLFLDIDWDTVIAELTIQNGVSVTTDKDRWDLVTPEYLEIEDIWINANINPSSIKWINYYPDVHFSNELINTVANFLNVKIHRAWISRIDPGYLAPWHWDVDDNEAEYLSKGTPIRYSIFITPASMGHVLIVNNKYYHSMPHGSIIKWDNYKDWHCGINGGLIPKFMLHLLAYE